MRTNYVEPFFLRCETCQARLRVRDEQFLGQVQSCPKCGSMVQIVAPAGWLATGEAAPAPEAAEVAAASAPTMGARVVSLLREHAVLWSTGAAALVAVGLAAFLTLRGGEEVAALPHSTPVVVASVAEPSDEPQIESPPAEDAVVDEPTVKVAPPATPILPPRETVATVERAEPPAVTPPPIASAPPAKPEKPRTLTLEPVNDEAKTPAANSLANAMPVYPPAIETETGEVEAKPQAAEPPARVTNFADQLAVPIESIDMPAMPIGEFVNLVSGMAAVPIKLDAKVLGDVGLSTRSTVTVRGDNTTVGKLLARVLKEHHLTCVERDGVLVVVEAQR